MAHPHPAVYGIHVVNVHAHFVSVGCATGLRAASSRNFSTMKSVDHIPICSLNQVLSIAIKGHPTVCVVSGQTQVAGIAALVSLPHPSAPLPHPPQGGAPNCSSLCRYSQSFHYTCVAYKFLFHCFYLG